MRQSIAHYVNGCGCLRGRRDRRIVIFVDAEIRHPEGEIRFFGGMCIREVDKDPRGNFSTL